MESNDPLDILGQPRLNFDVLRLVCNELTNASDVLSFALTCSKLKKCTLQRSLRMSPVVLSLPDSVERFHKFVFADPPSRAPFLYRLSISPDLYHAAKDDYRFVDCLVTILEAAAHLEYLSFATTLGLPVCSAVTKLTTLQELIVYSDARSYTQSQPDALNILLTALRSPLHDLCLARTDFRELLA